MDRIRTPDPGPVDYALNQMSSVYHVALALDELQTGSVTFDDLVKAYEHAIPADLNRVKRHNKLKTDRQATEWLIRRAIGFLGGDVTISDAGVVAFANGVSFDDLRYQGQALKRPGPDIYANLRDPFNPLYESGIFSENIRRDLGDLTELRDSMKAWGWMQRPQFRALGDARTKVILIGNRRVKVAKELGLDWESNVDWVEIGDGDAADAERFQLAIASNIGAEPISAKDRARIAAHLYGTGEGWSQARIAEVLKVNQKTVSRDLGKLGIVPNPAKGGRPRQEVVQEIQALAAENPQAFRAVVKADRAEDQQAKKARRDAIEAETGRRIRAFPDERYGVIYADPEWRFEVFNEDTGSSRSAANHYAVSDIEVIKARDVASISAPDCVLALWSTAPMLLQALEVMTAWGFTYKSQVVWVKNNKIGTGYWFRNQHEILLIGTRGKPPAPAMGTQFASVIHAPVGRHSAKPETFLELLEQYFPNLPKIELNRRGPPRPGWEPHGPEVEIDEEAD